MRAYSPLPLLIAAAIAVSAGLASAQEPAGGSPTPAAMQQQMPDWIRRGLPGPGHAALQPLIGTWRVHFEIYGTLGRSGDEPPIVSDDLIAHREWVADGRYIEDTTEGTVEGLRYWRRGWLGYSNMDSRYEWVTIDAINSMMMIYQGSPGSGASSPIDMTGVFTDQGVAGEQAVGKEVPMRTIIRIDGPDRHVIELYFTPPGRSETLATRATYARIAP
jgi:hypothetical protein